MADFAAILKKTLDKMGETTPDVRGKVYDRARQTVRRQIDAMATPPPQAAIDRQFEKLEAAIDEIEMGYVSQAAPVVEPEPEPAEAPEDVTPEAVEAASEAGAAPVVKDVTAEPVEAAAEPEAAPVVEDVGVAPVDGTVEPAPSADDELVARTEETAEPASLIEDEAVAEAEEPVETESDAEETTLAARPAETTESTIDPVEVDPVVEMPSQPASVVDGDKVSVTEEAVFADADDVSIDADDAPARDTSKPLPAAEWSSEPDLDPARDNTASADGDADVSDWIDEAVDADEGVPPEDALVEFLNEQKEQLSPAVDEDADRAVDALFDEIGPVDRDAATMPPEIGDAPPSEPVVGEPVFEQEPKRGRTGLMIALLLLVGLVAGGGYAAYANQGPLRTFLADYGITLPVLGPAGNGVVSTDNGVPVRTVETQPAPAISTEDPTQTTQVNETVDAGNSEGAGPKFTQRLTSDGREVDEGPASEPGGPGEGSSVAGQTAEVETPGADAGADQAAEGQTPVAVGQRTIFYEERTGSQAGTALQGATVWSVVQEAPGGDLPLEPAIRAQSSVPDLGMTLEMTIRRNGDATFPASHIVELFFNVPSTFEGRGIADVQRITFKNTEQDPGSALIAVPAPIDTNIFLVALTDAQTAVDTNIALMRSQGWLDIPMQYVSGRRALITMEKGVAGDRVFNEVFEAWQATPLDTAAAEQAEPAAAQ